MSSAKLLFAIIKNNIDISTFKLLLPVIFVEAFNICLFCHCSRENAKPY